MWILKEFFKEAFRILMFLFLLITTILKILLQAIIFLVTCKCFRCLRKSQNTKISPSATLKAPKESKAGLVQQSVGRLLIGDPSLEADLPYQIRINRLKGLKEREFYDRFRDVLAFFEHNTAQIELDYKEHIYTRQFISIPYFKYLPKEIKTDFNDNVD